MWELSSKACSKEAIASTNWNKVALSLTLTCQYGHTSALCFQGLYLCWVWLELGGSWSEKTDVDWCSADVDFSPLYTRSQGWNIGPKNCKLASQTQIPWYRYWTLFTTTSSTLFPTTYWTLFTTRSSTLVPTTYWTLFTTTYSTLVLTTYWTLFTTTYSTLVLTTYWTLFTTTYSTLVPHCSLLPIEHGSLQYLPHWSLLPIEHCSLQHLPHWSHTGPYYLLNTVHYNIFHTGPTLVPTTYWTLWKRLESTVFTPIFASFVKGRIGISTSGTSVRGWIWCRLINSCGRFLDGLVSSQFLKESYPSISRIDCKNQPSSHECTCCFTTNERMAGTRIKFRFRLCHADIKAGNCLHCHHHRWLWLASQHAELAIRIGPCIGTNSAYKREWWYVTKSNTPSAELARLSWIWVILPASYSLWTTLSYTSLFCLWKPELANWVEIIPCVLMGLEL
jgi:hypothetical protein